jgi:WD40 repeat protein
MRAVYLVISCILLGTVVQGQSAPPQASQEPPRLMIDANGHSARIVGVAFTPDGRYVVTAARDRTIRIWDLVSSEAVRVIHLPAGPGLRGSLFALALSADGKTIAVAGAGLSLGPEEAPIFLISFETGQIDKVLTGHPTVTRCLAFSADGKRLASGSEDQTIRIHDLKTGKVERVLQGHTSRVRSLAFAPDGKRLVSVDRVGRIWSLTSGKVEAVLQDGNRQAESADWSPDGATVAVGNLDGSATLWNVAGKLQKTITGLDLEVGVLFGPGGQELLVTGVPNGSRSTGACIVQVASGNVRTRLAHQSTVCAACLSRDGTQAATCGLMGNELKIWKTSDGTARQTLAGRGHGLYAVGWGGDGKSIAYGTVGTSNEVNNRGALQRSFDLKELQFSDAPPAQAARSQARRGNRLLQLTDAKTLAIKEGERTVHSFTHLDNQIMSFTWVADGRALVGTQFHLLLLDTNTNKILRRYEGHSAYVMALAAAPDGRRFVSGSLDQTIRIWDVDREQPLLSLFLTDEDWIAWTEEGLYAASANGERLIGWQVNNGATKLASYFAAAQFRKSLYQPEVIKQVVAAGSVDKALALAGKKPGDFLSVAQVLPPSVTITSPSGLGEIRIPQSKFDVKATAKSSGKHAVTALRLLVDGRPYKGQAGVKAIAAPKLGEVQVSWSVELPPGRHSLAVVAESAVSRSISPFTEVTVAGASASEQPSLYVFAVGINEYPGGLRLNYAAPDADAIADVLQRPAKKAFRAVEVKLIKDKQATKKEIEQGLAWLGSKMTSQDVGILFFSGHGDRDKQGNFYLVPVDVNLKDIAGSCVSGDYLKKSLGEMPGRMIAVLDACHSGAAGGARRAERPLADDLVRDLITEDYGIVVLSSSLGREYSLESPSIKHGFFTLALVEGLSGKADFNGDGLIHLSEVDAYAGPRVKEMTYGMQNPVMAKPATIRSFPLAKR